MRILFTGQAVYSHLAPVVLPVARMARDAGHEVAVATGPDAVPLVEQAGLPALALPNVKSISEVMRNPQTFDSGGAAFRPPRFGDIGRRTVDLDPAYFAGGFVGALGRLTARDLLDLAPDWKPDLILRESTEYGGYLAAERLGIRHGALDIGPMAPYGHPRVAEEVDRQRAALGLPPAGDPWHALASYRAAVVPEMFYPREARLSSSRHYRIPPRQDEPLDQEIAALPGDRPLVMATLGSNAAKMPGSGITTLLDVVVSALGDLPVTGVVALGAGQDPAQWAGARPDNVHLVSFVQQEALLPSCDAFVTHAGFNGTREALDAGVPMVAVPLFAEQSANAARLAELGVARALRAEETTRESLAAAVRAVVEEPGYRSRAKAMQRRARALPHLRSIVDDIAALAG